MGRRRNSSSKTRQAKTLGSFARPQESQDGKGDGYIGHVHGSPISETDDERSVQIGKIAAPRGLAQPSTIARWRHWLMHQSSPSMETDTGFGMVQATVALPDSALHRMPLDAHPLTANAFRGLSDPRKAKVEKIPRNWKHSRRARCKSVLGGREGQMVNVRISVRGSTLVPPVSVLESEYTEEMRTMEQSYPLARLEDSFFRGDGTMALAANAWKTARTSAVLLARFGALPPRWARIDGCLAALAHDLSFGGLVVLLLEVQRPGTSAGAKSNRALSCNRSDWRKASRDEQYPVCLGSIRGFARIGCSVVWLPSLLGSMISPAAGAEVRCCILKSYAVIARNSP